VFRGAGRRSGRRGVRRDRTSLECPRPPAGAVRGLQVSRGNVLEHLLLQRQIGDETLEADILPLQVLHPLRLIELKTTVFLPPAIVTLLRNSGFPAGHRRGLTLRHQHFNLTEQHHDLLRAEPLLRHNQSSFPSSVSHKAWSKKARSGHGYNAALNKIINETLSRNGKLTEADLEQIYETYLSQHRTTERIDTVGTRVINEIDDVMNLITDALGMTSTFGRNLEGATQKLSGARDREQVKAVVEALVATTREMQETNKALEARLATSKQQISSLQHSLEAIRNESLTDPLTSLGNRKFFDRALENAVAQAAEGGEPLSLLMLDIDHFKSFNDNYGHLTGDQVLRLVAMSLKQTTKGQDIAARYGGEEFAVVLPNTALRQALTVADNIRRAVMSKQLKKKSTGEILGRVTISVGVSMLQPGDDRDRLIERADACLYAAKRNGRNRVICEADPEFSPTDRIQVA
jgi:diguanylate cyclase